MTADDETTAERAAEEAATRAYPPSDPYNWTGSVPRTSFASGFVAGAAWAAGRRVAPDRETKAAISQAMFGHDVYPNLIGGEVEALDRVLTLLASGVLGIPADSATSSDAGAS